MQTTENQTKAKAAKETGSEHPSGDQRFKSLDITIKRNQHRQDALIEMLHDNRR